jgi:zinc transporter ZupT
MLISTLAKLPAILWVAERILPSASSINRRFQALMLGVMLAVASGVLISLAATSLLVAMGVALYNYAGVSVVVAVLAVAGIAILVAIMLFQIGKLSMSEAIHKASHDDTDDRKKNRSPLEDLFNGFVEGLMVESPPRPASPETARKPFRSAA